MARAQDFEDFVQSRYAALAPAPPSCSPARAPPARTCFRKPDSHLSRPGPRSIESAADAYVRTTMVRLLLRATGARRWSGEIPHGELLRRS